ncbi:ABC transporter permease [Haliea sp. E1-2-M8]|uniref:ABC transporter permease n=1 Tax=Haliea sp. E1-2-M8 TaxID=3064706 RepID=UPI002718E88D|nr:ABC transporter permease [Haliea sp. E1-2-M8]MDO8861098.1 ABC transporter permease [Haliea sp. E1-2-M8]
MNLTQYFSLIDTMARMSLKADASRYFFGYIWWVLEPLLYVLVFYVVFELILQNRKEDFLVFLMVGKLTFIWFSKSVNQAARSIVNSGGLISKANISKSLFPMAMVQEGLYKQLSVFLLLFVVLLFNGYPITTAWFWLIPLILVNYIVIVASCLVCAFLVCLVFDFIVMVSLGTIFLLFVSGIFWDPRDLPDPAATDLILLLNPLAFVIDAYRQILMVGVAPDAWHLLGIGAGFGLLALGMVLLLRRASRFLALKVLTA